MARSVVGLDIGSAAVSGTEVRLGCLIFAGHSMIAGTRMPPSSRLPLRPESPAVKPCLSAPLSLQYHSRVFSAISSLRSPFRSFPMAASMPVISPQKLACALVCLAYISRYFFVATCGLWGLPNQITARNGLFPFETFPIHLRAASTVTSELSPFVSITFPL